MAGSDGFIHCELALGGIMGQSRGLKSSAGGGCMNELLGWENASSPPDSAGFTGSVIP